MHQEVEVEIMKQSLFLIVLLMVVLLVGCQRAIDTSVVTPESSLQEKLEVTQELAKNPKKNPESFSAVQRLFPDIEKVATYPNEDAKNMMKLGDESHYWSPSAKKTFVRCDSMNVLIAVQ